jgi:ABC-type multidrug transport system fused ATPase/permease subunit
MEKTNFKKGIKGIWRHIKFAKKQIIIISVISIFSALANGSIPLITGKFFDALIEISKGVEVSESFPVWATLLTIWALVQLFANNFDWIADRLKRNFDAKAHIFLQAKSIIYLLRLPTSFHKNEHIQDVFQKISVAGWRVSTLTGRTMEIVPQLLSVFVGIILAATINIQLASILVIGVFLYSLLLIKILRPVAVIDNKAHELWNKTWDDSVSAINQIDIVKQSATEDYEQKKIEDNFMGKTYRAWYKMETIWSNVGTFQRLIVFLTQLTIFVMSVQFIFRGEITVGELIALNGYAAMFFGPFVSLGYSWQTFQNGITAAANLEEIFENKPEIYNPKNAVSNTISGKVNFSDVTFKYDDYKNNENVLDKVNFDVDAGEVVALVGESGSGKSTLISLMSAYYFPQEGKVFIDDIETLKYNLTSLRKQISIVPQEISLFNDTLEKNIKYGSFEASEENMIEATKKAHIYDYIQTLPDKFKTVVGERGVKLSVGQKQRIAIARAILQNPKILILDEPTSALDAITEKKITESLDLLMKERTTFIIAHRLSTVRKANKILVFDKGKIVETGNHEELLKIKNGYYRKLHDYQIGLY